jgi:hypothetical protein
MFFFNRPGRRRKPEPSAPLSARNRPVGLPPFGNLTGLELMALFMSR